MSLGLFIHANHTPASFRMIVFLREYCLPLRDGNTRLEHWDDLPTVLASEKQETHGNPALPAGNPYALPSIVLESKLVSACSQSLPGIHR